MLAFSQPAIAAPTASAFVSELSEQAIAELRRTAMADTEREDRFRRLFLQSFDVDTIARFVIGRHWRTATPVQQQRYQRVFPEYVVKVLSKLAPVYSGETIEILQEQPIEPDGDVLVRARLRRTDVALARIDFRVRETAQGPRIIDLVVGGISLLTTQRAEFDSIVGREGVGGLIASMERMLP